MVNKMKAVLPSKVLKHAVTISAEAGPEVKIAASPNGIRFISVGEDGVSAVVVECKKPAVKSIEVAKAGELFYLNSTKLNRKVKGRGKTTTLIQEKNSGVLGIKRGYLMLKQPLIKSPDYAHTPVKQFHEGIKTVVTLPVEPLHELFEAAAEITDGVRIQMNKTEFCISSSKTGDSARVAMPAKKCKKFHCAEEIDLRVTSVRLANFLSHATGNATFYLKNNYPITTEIRIDAGIIARQIVAPRGKEK
jgi:hypothetical protein